MRKRLGICLYPELLFRRSLEGALNSAFKSVGGATRAVGFHRTLKGSRFWAALNSGSRHSDVTVAIDERLFMAPLWHSGVQLANLNTPHLLLLAKALEAWFAEGVSAARLKQRFPAVTLSASAAAYEAGPAVYVSHAWRELLTRLESKRSPVLPLATAAFHAASLSGLLPYTSLNRLCFSRFTGYPFSNDLPLVEAGIEDATFVVNGPGTDGPIICSSVHSAIEALTARIPLGITSAIHGTAEGITA